MAPKDKKGGKGGSNKSDNTSTAGGGLVKSAIEGDKLAPVMAGLSELRSDFKAILQTVSNMSDQQRDDSKKILSALNTKLKDVDTKITGMDKKITEMENGYKAMKEKMIKLECQSRRDNLLLDGIAESSTNESWDDCKEKVYDILEQKLQLENARDIKIARCHRLGPKRAGSKRPRTIIFKLHWFGDRERIWRCRSNLQGTNIFLSEDFPEEIQLRRKKLYPYLRTARDLNMRASLSVDRLFLDGKMYTVDTLQDLPPEVKTANSSTRRVGNYLAFFRSTSPLSNFHPTPVEDDEGNIFPASENCYQYGKALFAGDREAAAKILRAKQPIEAYMIGLELKNFNKDTWHHTEANKCMYKACFAKFDQNPALKKALLDTKDLTIVEANPKDQYWSCGLSLRDNDIGDEDKWKGFNWLGRILMDIRAAIK